MHILHYSLLNFNVYLTDNLLWVSPTEVDLQLMPVCKPLLAADAGPELTWVSPAHVSTQIQQ